MAQAGEVQNGQTRSTADNGQRRGNTIFECLSPRSGTVLAALTADLLAEGLDADRIASLAAFITIIGDSLAFIAAQMELQKSDDDDSDTTTE